MSAAVRHHVVSGKRRHLHGWKRGKVDKRDKLLYSIQAPGYLPPHESLKGQPGLKVEDQGDIGSCTCNSSTSAMEFTQKKERGVDLQLSRLFAYDKVREYEGTPLTEDSGAEIRDVMKILSNVGTPLESQYPYDLSKWNVDPPASLNAEAAKNRIALYYRCPSPLTIKASIAQGFPVVGGFQVPESMMSNEVARTGIVKFDAAEQIVGGHAVLFTGYDDEKRMLQFMNSWSDAWGDGGYGYLDYAFLEHGYADDFFTVRRAA